MSRWTEGGDKSESSAALIGLTGSINALLLLWPELNEYVYRDNQSRAYQKQIETAAEIMRTAIKKQSARIGDKNISTFTSGPGDPICQHGAYANASKCEAETDRS